MIWNRKPKTIRHPEQERSEKLLELGNYLRQTRQAQSLSLEDVAAKTRIQMRLLQAIENGRLEQLPEPVYIQGFIRRFADALGLDGTAIAGGFPTGATPRPVQASWRDLPAAQLQPVHLYLIYIGVIILAVKGLSVRLNSTPEATPKTENQAQATIVATPPSPPSGPPVPTTSSGATTSSAVPRQVQVKTIITGESWMSVVADDKTVFEGILPAGTQKVWQAKQRLLIRTGNAGGVMIAANGETAKPMGALGMVAESSFGVPTSPAISP
ncbi:hypothetical protein DO97_02055 [Neosynechococcus sphagnicola sy1]|uniref:Cytoskeleton protein RodZ-like C-terminal domain-containing protein n=1 Tax=Neosynechococcus sphagnicola sy1 TaxID=1497020 RepID=A0A098TLE5_9CYAN|nr:RodZ domain-containing protein [Neosynechococcus sphagnicola]KGF73135.1 hypothetical protein DO97_02055 [Neosynechococcus sphagnicola sy1]